MLVNGRQFQTETPPGNALFVAGRRPKLRATAPEKAEKAANTSSLTACSMKAAIVNHHQIAEIAIIENELATCDGA